MKNCFLKVKSIVSILFSIWISYVFLLSLPYKFTLHPDTQHIFWTIWKWMWDTISVWLGEFFASKGSYFIWTAELFVSLILIAAVISVIIGLFWKKSCSKNYLFALWGLWASIIMAWAIFFHLFTALWIEVIHDGKSDEGSLYRTAVSIFVIWIIMFISHFNSFKEKFVK